MPANTRYSIAKISILSSISTINHPSPPHQLPNAATSKPTPPPNLPPRHAPPAPPPADAGDREPIPDVRRPVLCVAVFNRRAPGF